MLSTISKVYEKIAHDQLVLFLEDNNLFDSIQHGFRSGRSVISAAVEFLESIIKSVDKGENVLGVFMDLTKAFDSVKHSILIEKLQLLGVTKNSLNWFNSYLSNRSQYVEVPYTSENNRLFKISSTLQPVKFGVPQGSILGPLLFLCYLKNIGHSFSFIPENNLCLYADDSNMKISGRTVEQIEEIAGSELANIGKFLKHHNLKLNVEKTNYMVFKTSQNKNPIDPAIVYNNCLIERTFNTKFLGLTIDESLTWGSHVDNLLKKLNSGIYALSKMSFLANPNILKMLYFAHIHSHISYGLCLYGSTKVANLESILKIQKRAIRVILRLKSDESVRQHFKNLQILTVYGQYILDTILITKRNLGSSTEQTHSYNTRNRREIIHAHHRLEFYNKGPTYAGLKFIKQIPQALKAEQNMVKFKRNLKSYLIGKVIYSFSEFL